MTDRQKILFLQLPNLDNHVAGKCENLRLAGAYLRCALERSEESPCFKASMFPASMDTLDDAHLVRTIVRRERPSVIVATLYLWNVERTLDVLASVKKRLPSVRLVLGGPEVAPDHPFLFKEAIPDVVAMGEGEQVFPVLLTALRTGQETDLAAVAWRRGRRYVWGKGSLPRTELGALLPPADYVCNTPDASGIAYMETSRGCPLKCAFCGYNQKRRGVSSIPAGEVLRRARLLMARGAKEIRFVDPTFNSNPDFEAILRGLVGLNPRRTVAFFAELRAETITPAQADLLKQANVRDVEVGVQSRDRKVLRAIRRPTNLSALDRGVRLMSERGIRLTVDIMCGLPYQGLSDIRTSLKWAFGVKGAYVQFLHTLLIPGTELRTRHELLGLTSQDRPPYRVLTTSAMSETQMCRAENIALRYAGRLMDSPAEWFVGVDLPDLFLEKVTVEVKKKLPVKIPGRTNRRAILLHGDSLYDRKDMICTLLRKAITNEPHTLWQFVLCLRGEEPLDLLDCMIAEIREAPSHFLDRMTVFPAGSRCVARRVFVQLDRKVRYRKSWIKAVEATLSDACY